MRRMDRYKNEETTISREQNNQELYQNIGRNSRIANFSDVVNANAYDISSPKKQANTREDYQKYKEYNNETISREKKELDNFNQVYNVENNKVYDINDVLEKARKNREPKEEPMRKLQKEDLNILVKGSKEEIEKLKEAIKKKVIRPDDPEVKEMIDTIYSKTIAGELDKDTGVMLLSDLMATSVMDRVDNEKETELQEEKKEQVEKVEEKQEGQEEKVEESVILKKEDVEKVAEIKNVEEQKIMAQADTDFYSRSMDLSDKDFDIDTEFQEASMPIIAKIIIILLVLVALAAVGYFVWKRFF